MPSPEEIRSVMERYAKLMCDSDADGIAALYSDDCFVEDPVGGDPIRGLEAVRGFYAATSPNLQVEVSGPICVAGNQCAMPMLAELTMNDQKSYIDVIDVMNFDDDGKITSMKAYWSPMDMRATR
jgi:steroid delta-isomerase